MKRLVAILGIFLLFLALPVRAQKTLHITSIMHRGNPAPVIGTIGDKQYLLVDKCRCGCATFRRGQDYEVVQTGLSMVRVAVPSRGNRSKLTDMTIIHTENAKKSYDLIATLRVQATHSDTEAHITVDGQTYDSYCDVNESSVSCSDSAAQFIVTFADGNYTFLGRGNLDHSQCDDESVCEPLEDLYHSGALDDLKPVPFHYRTDAFADITGTQRPYYCVGFSITDKNGNERPQEACYQIFAMFSRDGQVVYPPRLSSPYHFDR